MTRGGIRLEFLRSAVRWLVNEDLEAGDTSAGFLVDIDVGRERAADNVDQNVRFRLEELRPDVRRLVDILAVDFASEKRTLVSCAEAERL